MKESYTLFAWFVGLLVIITCIIVVLLAFKFRRYFRANGFGIVTLTLVSLVAAHAIGILLFAVTTLTIIGTAAKEKFTVRVTKDTATVWLISSTLLHMISITLQRVFSCTYGDRFLRFTKQKKNIILVILNMWVSSIIITVLVMTSRLVTSFSVFYVGVFLCGVLTILSFVITVDTNILRSKPLTNSEDHELAININLTDSPSKRVRVVQTPRKTFSLFSGLLASFLLFILPSCIPNLIYNLQGKILSESTSIIISLWLLLGVVFDCMWILMRLRSTINSQSGFYARWTLRKSRDNLASFLNKRQNNNRKPGSMREKLVYDDSLGLDTEHESI